MTRTNKEHNRAVELVKFELHKINSLRNVCETDKEGVDLQATINGQIHYFFVIKGKKQKSQSIYAAISTSTWEFALNHFRTFFFIAAIEENENFTYYCYTPTEMWERNTTPYVQIKCNPLKRKRKLVELSHSFTNIIPMERYKDEKTTKKVLDKLKKLSEAINRL